MVKYNLRKYSFFGLYSMKDDESPLNIFQSSAHKKKKPPSEVKAQLNLESKTPIKPFKERPPLKAIPIPAKLDPEVQQMLKRIDEMRKDIENRIEFISRQSGWSKEKIWEYVNNPKNFNKDQWEIVQKENQKFVDKVWASLGSSIHVHKAHAHATTQRKGKFIGSRRNWIPTK